jgi:deazaflavin-dependent oxidoreductase (nitroreductase family)
MSMNVIGKAMIGAHVRLYQATGGRVGANVFGGHVLLLTTTGAKSGKARTVPVMYFDVRGKRVVVASYAGKPEDPAWFKNLSAHPEVEVQVEGRKYRARARALEGEERAACYREVVQQSARFAEYEKKAVTRQIPVVELVEVGGATA